LGSFGTLGGVIRSRVTHAVCWYCASPPTPKGETAGVALFFGVFMAIFLPNEIATRVDGDAGCIYIHQKHKGKETFVCLTVRQFREIWNHEKHLIAEAEAYEEKDPT
jgi:hypothetical protein